MARPTPRTYKTRNWPAYNEALKRRCLLTIWFDPKTIWPDMIWPNMIWPNMILETAPTRKLGRQDLQQYRLSDMPDDEGALWHGIAPDH